MLGLRCSTWDPQSLLCRAGSISLTRDRTPPPSWELGVLAPGPVSILIHGPYVLLDLYPGQNQWVMSNCIQPNIYLKWSCQFTCAPALCPCQHVEPSNPFHFIHSGWCVATLHHDFNVSRWKIIVKENRINLNLKVQKNKPHLGQLAQGEVFLSMRNATEPFSRRLSASGRKCYLQV